MPQGHFASKVKRQFHASVRNNCKNFQKPYRADQFNENYR